MSVKWNQNSDPALIISKIEGSRNINSDGRVRFEGWLFKEFEMLIYSLLIFPKNIPEIDARGMVSKAIFNCGEKGVITPQKMLMEVKKLERDYQSLPIKRYVLVTSISINQNVKLKRIYQDKNIISFDHSLPQLYQSEVNSIHTYASETILAKEPDNYMMVRVFVFARTIHNAANKALDILDFTRGIWNWFLNMRQYTRTSWGKPIPVNKIILGPIHTLHKPRGLLAIDSTWWLEPSYLGAIAPFTPNEDQIKKMYQVIHGVGNKLETHSYSETINNAFIRYSRALDERNWSTAFLKLWGVLELLTDTVGAKYELTVRRTSYLFQEHTYYRQILENLRKFRNASVHFDVGSSETESYLYQIKYMVESLLGFHINNKFGFNSIQEAAEFLNFPYEEKALKRKVEMLNFALKYRGVR